jgi:hypothetical protein
MLNGERLDVTRYFLLRLAGVVIFFCVVFVVCRTHTDTPNHQPVSGYAVVICAKPSQGRARADIRLVQAGGVIHGGNPVVVGDLRSMRAGWFCTEPITLDTWPSGSRFSYLADGTGIDAVEIRTTTGVVPFVRTNRGFEVNVDMPPPDGHVPTARVGWTRDAESLYSER